MAVKITDADGNTVNLKADNVGGDQVIYHKIYTVTVPSAIYVGRLTLAATDVAEVLGAEQTLTVGVTIKALATNVDTVDIGQSDVGADAGYPLSAGEEAFFSIDDLSTLYVIGTEGDGVAYHAE
jgi:hypothetical protein